jgi:hypothetical protein
MEQKGNRGQGPLLSAMSAGITALLLAGHALSSPVFDDIGGSFSDDFGDETAVTFRQNASVGPAFTPGTRLALTTWSWAQSYTQASDAVVQSFSAPGASFNLTQAIRHCATCFEMVGLWQKEYHAYRDVTLGPGVVTATFFAERRDPEPGELQKLVEIPWMEKYNGQYFVRTPDQTGLVPGKGYTVTFRSAFCDDPDCGKVSTMPARRDIFADNAEAAQYEVWLGSSKRASHQVCIGQRNLGSFFKERIFTDVTLEPTWPDPLPSASENKWDFRMLSTLSADNPIGCNTALTPYPPDCIPNCTTTLWIESINILAKGHPIAGTYIKTKSDCDALGAGYTPCGGDCLKVTDYAGGFVPCGWDAATYYVDSGSYVSPVFDSLSKDTVWERFFWQFNQNYKGGINPRTPMALKWRVGDNLNPATWIKDEHGANMGTWYMGTVPMSVSTWADPPGRPAEIPPPMKDADAVDLLYMGTHPKGRYFQYEVDFTSHFANSRFPPEFDDADLENDRAMSPCPSPWLRGVRVYYTAVRGVVVSQIIRPARLRKWGTVTFEPDLVNGGVVQVDVLDDQGNPLFANIPKLAGGFSISALSPERYPAIKLRVWLDNQGNSLNRPVLKSWGVTWDVNPDPLRIDRNLLDSGGADRATVTVNLNGERDGTLAVFDAAGQSIKVLCRCRFPAGVSTFTWDGGNERGETVAPGIYFISLKAKDVNRTGKLAVK